MNQAERAEVGDWVTVHGRTVGGAVRHGQVVGVPHPDGSPPWMVRWTDDDRTSLVVPGSDATVEHHPGSLGEPPKDPAPAP